MHVPYLEVRCTKFEIVEIDMVPEIKFKKPNFFKKSKLNVKNQAIFSIYWVA